MRQAILLFWPSFIIAALATGLFFSIFDPQELTLHGAQLFADKLSAYSVFFLIAWGFGALNTSIVLACHNPDKTKVHFYKLSTRSVF